MCFEIHSNITEKTTHEIILKTQTITTVSLNFWSCVVFDIFRSQLEDEEESTCFSLSFLRIFAFFECFGL